WLKTLYRKRAVTWPFIFYTIIWTLSLFGINYSPLLSILSLLMNNKMIGFPSIINKKRDCDQSRVKVPLSE
ncbi:hypothetical protein, partial [Enterococcus faecium]